MTTLPGGFHLIDRESVASTNDEAASLAASGAPDGTIVRASTQSAGRGRNGRIWVSEVGNLYYSLLVRPQCPPQMAVQLSFVTSVALAETVSQALPDTAAVTCKWPNDILVDGKKVAGMLLESAPMGEGALDWLVIGIGLNVASSPADVMYPATSLHASGAPGISADDLLADFCRRFANWRAVWTADGFEAIRDAWLTHAAGLGKEIGVKLASGPITGTFSGLDEQGALIVLHDSGEQTKITAGDVFFPTAPHQ